MAGFTSTAFESTAFDTDGSSPAPSTEPSLGGIMTIALLGQNYGQRNQRLVYGPKFPALRRRK